MGKLFEDKFDSAPADSPAGRRVVGLAVAANLWRTFDYVWPDEFGEPERGQRVRVPFGRSNRKTLAVVVDPLRRGDRARLKTVAELIDLASQLDETLWRLAEWISRYYLTPLGMTLAAMIPSAVGRHAAKTEAVVFLAAERRDWPTSLGGRQKRVLDELYEARKQGVEPLGLEELLRHSAASRDSVNRLAGRGLVRLETRPVRLAEPDGAAAQAPFELNDEQKSALEKVHAALDSDFSATLLYGVTGSGKTEIYVRAIQRVIAAGRQAILLVPEIALATQTLQRLLERLPRVAVLHSGLTGAQRSHYYEQIRDGHAAVVVGPRSAVFAPARKLGLIVVDEEHESSYKQDNAPRYHARDVAVMRASLAGVPVLLGTATPSLESMHNVQLGRYDMVRLPHRVRSLPMPKLQIVNLRQDTRLDAPSRRIELIGATLTRKIAAALDRTEQIILLLNRRGYASYVFCPRAHCGWMLSCEHCSRTMVFHQATQLAVCHYCGHTSHLPEHCPACRGKILLFGYGIQRIEGELARKFPEARVARMDSDTMTSPRQFRKVFDAFGAGEVDMLLGTQMVAKGLDFPRVSLVGVISADTSLAISDFRSAERTFQLIVQVAGRAGRGDLPGEVVVQTLHEQEAAIRFAVSHDYDGFAAAEMPLRAQANLPPFTRMVRFIVRHPNSRKAYEGAERLAGRLREFLPAKEVRFLGPHQAAIAKIQNRFRFEILLTFAGPGLVQQWLGPRMEQLLHDIPAEVLADVDPVNLM